MIHVKRRRLTASAVFDPAVDPHHAACAALTVKVTRATMFLGARGMQLVELVGERIWASCNYYNYGDTVALIHQCKLEIIIDKALPPRPVFKSPGKLIAYGQDPILPGESGGDYRRTLVEPATAEQLTAIASKDVNVFIVGCITFEDIFGVIRTRVGAMKLKDTMFVPTKGASYNFEVEGYYENPEEPHA